MGRHLNIKTQVSESNIADTVGSNHLTKSTSIVHCQACSSNQSNSVGKIIVSSNKLNRRRRALNINIMRDFSMWSILVITWINFFIVLTEGLQCYECLSLHCESGAVCDAIKNTMLEIFFPKRHFIHFDPNDVCPDNELPLNTAHWTNLSKECERSDSMCLISPIEVHTVVDGKKDGKQLDKEYTFTTYGYLLGCASRRKLLEFDETINVRAEFTGRNESTGGSGKGTPTGSNSQNGNGNRSNQKNRGSENSPGSLEQRGNSGSKRNTEIFYNLTNTGNGAVEMDPTKKTYKDGYTISKIYSHVFYIDQGTSNATRCLEDNCNNKVKFRIPGMTSGNTRVNSSSIAPLIVLLIPFFQLS